jgi:hypothetical protein
MFTPILPFSAQRSPLPSYPWPWLDVATFEVQPWFELQRALWQPWWDVQSQWLRFWQDGWPMLAPRGAEQLA